MRPVDRSGRRKWPRQPRTLIPRCKRSFPRTLSRLTPVCLHVGFPKLEMLQKPRKKIVEIRLRETRNKFLYFKSPITYRDKKKSRYTYH